ncbi:unnamed protein product [Prunus armeniaca]
MRQGISRPKELYEQSIIVVEAVPRRGSISLSLSIQYCRQFSINTQTREGRATNILCQQSTAESRASVSPLGAASTSPCCLNSKAPPILPGARDHDFDQSTASTVQAEKGQAVADFISELTPPAPSAQSLPNVETVEPERLNAKRFDPSIPVWILHVDGSANQQGCGASLVLTTPDGTKVEYALRFNFRTSNNEAKYEALLAGLRLAKSMSAIQIVIHSDSQLIVNQITADYAAKDASMSAYLSAPHQLLKNHADALSCLASAINDKIGRKVPVVILSQPSTATAEVCIVRYEGTWMSPIYAFLASGILPIDKSQARKLCYRSARYIAESAVTIQRYSVQTRLYHAVSEVPHQGVGELRPSGNL